MGAKMTLYLIGTLWAIIRKVEGFTLSKARKVNREAILDEADLAMMLLLGLAVFLVLVVGVPRH